MFMISRNGSTKERTICVAEVPCRNEKMLYFCTAFVTQVQDLKY